MVKKWLSAGLRLYPNRRKMEIHQSDTSIGWGSVNSFTPMDRITCARFRELYSGWLIPPVQVDEAEAAMDGNNQLKGSVAVLGVLLAFGIIVGGWVLGAQIKATRLSDRYVSVKGLVERTVKSDLVIWPDVYKRQMNKLRFVDMTYYVLRKDGAYAGVSLWEGYEPGKPHKIAVHDGTRRAENAVAMFKGFSQDFPPEPKVPEEVKKEYLK